MKIFNKLEKIKKASLALGFFDGMHLGHIEVIKTAVNLPAKSVVLTFKNSPYQYFSKETSSYILSNEKRHELFKNSGVDYLFEIDFNKEIAEMSANDYIKNILDEYFSPSYITTGFNHTFGKNKTGNPDLLTKMQNVYGYKYNEIKPVIIDDEIVSSTLIKKYIINGDLRNANKMLGHNFCITGRVIEGKKIGRTLGFPTINFKYPENIVKLPFGVYKTKYKEYNAITNYGIKPTVNNNEPILETHILNFNDNLYNKNTEINFVHKIRDEIKFNSLTDLQEQIKKDIEECLK